MNIVVLAGGISTERDVSLVSGKGVYKALKENGHNAILLDLFFGYDDDIEGIFTKDFEWAKEINSISKDEPDIKKIKELRADKSNVLFGKNVIEICQQADIVFLALHGDCGENGKIQATFDLFDIKYTGTDYLSSALAIDKGVSKSIFVQHGVTTPEGFILYKNSEKRAPEHFPCVVKVCHGGSSIGVYFVEKESEYENALEEAFTYEDKVVVEQFIKGKEYTDCVIEGMPLPIVSIEPVNGHYDYKNKYQAGSTIEICPAKISDSLTKRIQDEAVKAYNALNIETYARMDFIYEEDTDTIYCLEANTLPGMTPTSLIPQEAAAIGKSYNDLCEWIIDISLKKYKQD